jgi:HEAT repeat protein
VIALCVLAITMAVTRPVRADTVDNLIAQLDDSSDRVRTSAVLALMNQENPRAIDALARTLAKSGETKNVRGLAATALGRIVLGGKPNAAQKKTAIDALNVATGDPEPFVSAKASAALAQLGSAAPTTPTKSTGPSGGVYVNVGPMSSKTGNTADDPKYRASMQKTSAQTLNKIAPTYQTTWAGGGVPTKAQLAAKNMTGFYVDGTLNEVKVEKAGNSSKVSCKVNMLLASFPDKAVFGFLNGGAAVQASASMSDIALASQDCVAAVVESLITKQIVPTIKAKAP